MVNEPNKRKNSSHTRRTFDDLLLEIPIIGKPIHNLLKRKGGIMKKLGAFALIAVVLIALVWWHYGRSGQQTTSHNKTATATGDNSSATNQSATTSGSNNTVIQAAPGATVVNGLSDKGLNQIQEGMLALQKQKDAELRAIFNVGYILFTATERNQIVPLNSTMDNILKVNWESGYNVSFSDNTVTLRLPETVFSPPNTGAIHFGGSNNITVYRHFEPFARPGFVMGNYRLAFKVVSIDEDSIIIAMGIQSPPPKRPSMEELMKYSK